MRESDQEQPMQSPPGSFWQKIKHPLKWIALILILLAVAAAVFSAWRLSQRDFFGWRLNFSFDKVETSDYHGFAPSLAFQYPRIFEADIDPEKKYGKDYLVGIKLKTDERTGCDIRTSGPDLDFSKSADELAEKIVGPIREKATDFRLIEKKKTKIGGRDALKVSFSFRDPIGARVRLDQVFTSNEGVRYMIICGTGEYQYAFFEKDFRLFYDSLNFKGELPGKNKKWWQEALDIFRK